MTINIDIPFRIQLRQKMKEIPSNIHLDHTLGKFTQLIENLPVSTQIFVLTDTNTKLNCLPVIQPLTDRLLSAYVIEMDAGETNKNISSLTAIIDKLVEAKADRNSLLLNLGGGVICDIGGFAASIYKRGIPYIHLPTSLLAQLDAAIGGKNGIDYLNHKNFLGTIGFPEHVFISKQFLATLPSEEMTSGLAEALKHGLIADRLYWDQIKNKPLADIDLLLAKSIEIKSAIVKNDPTEKNTRKKLNAGHTVGHAIESMKLAHGTPVLHGAAVAAGLIMESFISKELGHLSELEFKEIDQVISSHFTPIKLTNSDFDELVNFMNNDKKNINRSISFSFIRKIGDATYDDHCESTLIQSSLSYYTGK